MKKEEVEKQDEDIEAAGKVGEQLVGASHAMVFSHEGGAKGREGLKGSPNIEISPTLHYCHCH